MVRIVTKIFICYMILCLAGCAKGPGYELQSVDDGSYECVHKEKGWYGMEYFEITDYNKEASKALFACKEKQKEIKNKYRCGAYVSVDFMRQTDHKWIYSGLGFGNSLYHKCLAKNGENCVYNYAFADCIAAKCSYNSEQIEFGNNMEDWISESDWNSCVVQHL